jgi:hypothetical protein
MGKSVKYLQFALVLHNKLSVHRSHGPRRLNYIALKFSLFVDEKIGTKNNVKSQQSSQASESGKEQKRADSFATIIRNERLGR